MNKMYAYKYIRNGEYAIYEFEGILTNNDYYEADEYTVYTTKEGGKKGSVICVDNQTRFARDTVYKSKSKLIEDIEIEYTNKLKYIRKELGV